MNPHERFPRMESHRDDGAAGAGGAESRPGADPEGEPRRDAGAARILVADDNEDCRLALTSFLEASGYRVEEAADGEEAVRLARDFAPDLILLDIMMPGVDGLEAARRIRRATEAGDVRIVAISAMEGAEQASLAAGCDECVSKPLDMTEFPARVGRWLGAE